MPQSSPQQATPKIDLEVFAEIDLNLMVVFMVLFEERSVSRSALKLGLGQPAVSGSLRRLRACLGNPLFLRVGHRMQPTVKAEQIAAQLAPAIRTIQSILAR